MFHSDRVEWEHTVRRNRSVAKKFREANRAYAEYKRAYRRWCAAFWRNDRTRRMKDLEADREICARKASEAFHDVGTELIVLAWSWTWGE